jgi:hypothetical protein
VVRKGEGDIAGEAGGGTRREEGVKEEERVGGVCELKRGGEVGRDYIKKFTTLI